MKSKIKKWILVLSLFLILIFEFLSVDFIVSKLVHISPTVFLKIIVLYILWFITIYIFPTIREAKYIEKHQLFFSVLTVIIPIMLFFLQTSVQDMNSFKKYEVSLKEENNRNNSHLQSIISDIPNDPSVMFWREFSTRSYIEFWDYIHLNKSQECKNLYATLTINLNSLNNINKMRQSFVLIPNNLDKLNKDMHKAAVATKPIMDLIVGKCQSL